MPANWHWGDSVPDDEKLERYNCGYCGRSVYGKMFYQLESYSLELVMCPECENPTIYYDQDDIRIRYPPEPAGDHMAGLPESINGLYLELRKVYGFNLTNSFDMLFENILKCIKMTGYKPGRDAPACVAALKKSPDMTSQLKRLADAVLTTKSGADAREAKMNFITQLLRSIYEVDHMAREIISGPKPAKDPAKFKPVLNSGRLDNNVVALLPVKEEKKDPSDDDAAQTP